MGVHSREVEILLKFTKEEKEKLSASFIFGDAEEQLSYAVDQFGSERVATLIVESKSPEIALLALAEVDGFSDADKKRLLEIAN